jgi:hypothetical protein
VLKRVQSRHQQQTVIPFHLHLQRVMLTLNSSQRPPRYAILPAQSFIPFPPKPMHRRPLCPLNLQPLPLIPSGYLLQAYSFRPPPLIPSSYSFRPPPQATSSYSFRPLPLIPSGHLLRPPPLIPSGLLSFLQVTSYSYSFRSPLVLSWSPYLQL